MGAPQSLPYPNDQIHCIIPPTNGIGGLFLSSVVAAKDFSLLQRLGIKAVITVAYQAADLKYPQQLVPYHLHIEARDEYTFNLYDFFDGAVDFIAKHLRGTNVLVHCIGGRSRSASLVVAYLIRERNMTKDDAIAYVKNIRKIINPNYGFRWQLQEYENTHLGKRNVISLPPNVTPYPNNWQNNFRIAQSPAYRVF